MSTAAPRSLADQLRGWSDERLTALLLARPDLATPAPHDSSQLAARVVVRSSVLRALDGLDLLELTVLQSLVQQTDPHDLPAAAEAVDAALDRLDLLALVWGVPPRPVSVVTDLLAVPPGPPSERVAAALPTVDAQARAILDHLVTTSAEGRWSGRAGPTADLVAAGLLARRDERHVVVPWSVRLGWYAAAEHPLDAPPALATSERDAALVDRAAAGAAFEAVRRTELLLDRWGTHAPPALKGGGLSVRDLKATTGLLHVETDVAALVVETAAAAGLLAQGMTDDLDGAWLPTEAYDAWLVGDAAHRWLRLTRAWLESPRLVSLVGGRVADKPVNALSPDLERSWLRDLRHDVLTELAALPPGVVLAPVTGLPSLVERLRWRRPRRPASRWQQVAPLLAQAALLGLTGLDGPGDVARRLLAGDEQGEVVDALAALLPGPVDHVLLQADLTAVAPGPLEHDVTRKLAMVADVESRGGATVYRFAASSVRRAFDAGWSVAEVHEFVGSVSRTPVPQSLTYLVDDVSRRFGTLRAGRAESFLRSDDETALTELLHAPGAGTLRLRRLAPTVLVSDVALGTLLPRLRELGLAPVVEAADGTVQVARPDVFRSRAPRRGSPSAVRSAARTGAVVAAVRSGDRTTRTRSERALSASTPTEVITLLREAVETRGELVIGYVGNDGTVAERVVTPVRVEGGQLTAYDERSDADRTFAVHRITAVTRQPG